MVKLVSEEGILCHILDTWSSIRPSIEYNNLYFSTPDKQSILFNREIICFLSPLLSRLIKGTGGSCCLVNNTTTIILPDFSSKTVYDLDALMVNGTARGLSSHDAEQLKELHRFLGLKSILVKEENDDEVVVEHEYRMVDDRTDDGVGGYGGDSEGESPNKDDRSFQIESRGVVINDDIGVQVPIPTSFEENDNDADMSDRKIDNSTDDGNVTNNREECEVNEDLSSTKNDCKTALDLNADMNDKSKDNDDDADINVHQDFNSADGVELEELKEVDNEGKSSQIKSRLRKKKKVSFNFEESFESDDSNSDATFHVKNVRRTRKRKRSGSLYENEQQEVAEDGSEKKAKEDRQEQAEMSKENQRVFSSNEKKYQCSFCSKKEKCLHNLRIHERIHTSEKPFECLDCQTKFASISNLNTHKRKGHQCSFCSKKEKCLHNLRIHERKHTGEKPFECLDCQTKFASISNLNTHKKKGHCVM